MPAVIDISVTAGYIRFINSFDFYIVPAFIWNDDSNFFKVFLCLGKNSILIPA